MTLKRMKPACVLPMVMSSVIVAVQKTIALEQYFKTAAQMTELFADIPTAIENTYHIARRCKCVIASRLP